MREKRRARPSGLPARTSSRADRASAVSPSLQATRPRRSRASASDGSAATAERRDRCAFSRCSRTSRRCMTFAGSAALGSTSTAPGEAARRQRAAASPRSSRRRGASRPSRGSRAGPVPPSRAPRPSGSRPAPGRPSPRTTGGRRRDGRSRPSACGRSSTAADSWSRGGSPSRRARWAQSLWSISAARTGNRSHGFAAGQSPHMRALCQRTLSAGISSRRRRSGQVTISTTAPSRSPDEYRRTTASYAGDRTPAVWADARAGSDSSRRAARPTTAPDGRVFSADEPVQGPDPSPRSRASPGAASLSGRVDRLERDADGVARAIARGARDGAQ